MDIALINASESLYQVKTVGKWIAEYCRDKKNRFLIHIHLFNPENNTIREIAPERHIIDFVEIVNGIWNCSDVYYTTFEVLENMQMRIFLFRYSPDSDEEKEIFSFVREMDAISGNTKIKVFLLSESAILIQTEVRKSNISQNMLGNIAFHLVLHNLEAETDTIVSDTNLLNNGIDIIVPVSEKRVMVKTGYSYLEDSRLNGQISHESLIESVYLTTMAKFIADLTISSESLDMTLIESTYLDKHITRPFVTDTFTHFTVADAVNHITKCVFFQNETEERVEYTVNSFQEDNLYLTHVINRTPYVRKTTEDEVQFFNLKTALTDIVFYDDSFLAQMGDVFLLSSVKEPHRLHLYAYPGLKQMVREKLKYVCMTLLNGTYYIYTLHQ